MKNALSLVCMLLAGILMPTTSFAQSNTLFNPDYNGDGFIGVDDILGALSFYDTAWEGPVSPSWSCGEAITYAGVGYSTVQIGDQCWFAEDLRTVTYLNGEAIPQPLSPGDWSSTTSGAMAFYNYVSTNPGLYNFFAVDDPRGLCPSGWHVPTNEEWTILNDHLWAYDPATDVWSGAAGQLKATYGWYGGNDGTNSSGFSALPGGYVSNGEFYYAGSGGLWWSSSPYDDSYAWYRYMYPGDEGLNADYWSNIRNGYLVRCVRDAE